MPALPAKLAANATQGMFDLFTIRFLAGWQVSTGGPQAYGMDASGDGASMDFALADPNHASWSNDQWLSAMFANLSHIGFTKGTRTFGGVTWTSYSCQAEPIANDTASLVYDETLFGRHNGNTFTIQLQAKPADFPIFNVQFFTPSLKTFAFTS